MGKMRQGMLVKKLSEFATEKKEAKDKKKREKVVIVKDTKPLLENLEEIEEEIKKEDIDKLLKQKTSKKKISKHTMKQKNNSTGLSNSASKALLDIKDTLKIP